MVPTYFIIFLKHLFKASPIWEIRSTPPNFLAFIQLSLSTPSNFSCKYLPNVESSPKLFYFYFCRNSSKIYLFISTPKLFPKKSCFLNKNTHLQMSETLFPNSEIISFSIEITSRLFQSSFNWFSCLRVWFSLKREQSTPELIGCSTCLGCLALILCLI